MASDNATSTALDEALALLALPDLDGLTDGQTRGAICVWGRDEDRLTPETAVDLGEHLSPLRGSTSQMRWFPRACNACTGEAAFRALHEHAPTCEQCVDDASRCEIGRALWRLVRDGHRYGSILKRLAAGVRACEPCATARIFGGEHRCTGTAHRPAGQPCPCCPKASGR
jgi:hypothetical protein